MHFCYCFIKCWLQTAKIYINKLFVELCFTKVRAKVHKIFDICKYFWHIARNQHEIAENKYKEDRKNCYME